MYKVMYRSYIYAEKEILLALLENNNPITYKKRIQGNGLKDSDFDSYEFVEGKKIKKFPMCSRRVFGYKKKSLLKRKLIIKLMHRGNRDNYYSITPLGICYLSQFLDAFTKYQGKKVLENLKFFYESIPFGRHWMYDLGVEFDFSTIWEKLEKVIEESSMLKSLKEICSYVTLENAKEDHIISMIYPLHEEMKIIMGRYRIVNDKQIEKMHKYIRTRQKKNSKIVSTFSDIYANINYGFPNSDHYNEVDLAGFFYWLSMFILYAFHFKLVKNNFDTFSRMLSDEIENKGKIKGKKIKHAYNELNKIGLYPYDVIDVAGHFSGNLNFVLEQTKLELDQFNEYVEQYRNGTIMEMPTSIETSGPHPIVKIKNQALHS